MIIIGMYEEILDMPMSVSIIVTCPWIYFILSYQKFLARWLL